MREIDLYLCYLNEQNVGDKIAGGVARGLGKVQGLVGKGMMAANLMNFGHLAPVSQALTGMAAGGMALNTYQNWKQKRAAQQQGEVPSPGQQHQLAYPSRRQ